MVPKGVKPSVYAKYTLLVPANCPDWLDPKRPVKTLRRSSEF